MSFLSAAGAHVLGEKNISLGANPGLQFEAESSTFHFSARFYLVGTALYRTVVVAPLGKPYSETTRFLDSFQVMSRAGPVGR